MRFCLCLLAALAFAAAPAAAGPTLFQMRPGLAGLARELLFAIPAPTTVTLKTYRYAGCTVGATALLPGTYTAALLMNGNTPLGEPADSAANKGNPGFSCVDAGYLPGTL